MNYLDFGQSLVESGDLDPLYIVLSESEIAQDRTTLARWLFGYWCFYHAGVATRLAEQPNYWEGFRRAIKSAPRGRERRHFRGNLATNAVTFFEEHWEEPEHLVEELLSGDLSWAAVSKRVQKLPAFGPWMAFKVADMAERVMGDPVDFSGCELELYAEPVKGAKIVACDFWGWPSFDNRTQMRGLVDRLLDEFGSLDAPPDLARKVNVQEVETILCKFKGHHLGRYPVGHDIKALISDLERTDQNLYAIARGIWG